ncbi:hypothetical protein [Paenibacillus sp. ACRRX]|uniref:hypothetical protein n=1 Tax=Paenibacillus sp. ACRRX TaxID=2918206 RepID=UPI001EF65263|nr:hypothetical protein [Paenibacillus sp. ACRRX]
MLNGTTIFKYKKFLPYINQYVCSSADNHDKLMESGSVMSTQYGGEFTSKQQ